MQHPKLRAGNPARRFDLAKVTADGAVDQPELLQHVERQLLMPKLVSAGHYTLPFRLSAHVSFPYEVQCSKYNGYQCICATKGRHESRSRSSRRAAVLVCAADGD